jgi:hypothetical protein
MNKTLLNRFLVSHSGNRKSKGSWSTIKEAVESSRVKGVCFLVKAR